MAQKPAKSWEGKVQGFKGLLFLQKLGEDLEGGGIKSNGKMAREELVLQIVWSMVHNNHPVSVDRGLFVIF
jgi:hypothetical protein